MLDLTRVFILCFGAMLLNVPFGFYRMGAAKFSWQWFLAIHLPIPFLLVARLAMGISWRAIPLVLVCAILGQIAGGRLRKRWVSKQQIS